MQLLTPAEAGGRGPTATVRVRRTVRDVTPRSTVTSLTDRLRDATARPAPLRTTHKDYIAYIQQSFVRHSTATALIFTGTHIVS